MKIIGNAQFAADRPTVWRALNDPAVLASCIPGCQRLEALGDDAYAMTVAAGVGSIKGVYDGQVSLTEQEHPGSFVLNAQGAGAAGTIGAAVRVTLEETAAGGTSVTYDADAVVGGMIGGVGQRMLVGVSKRMAEQFFHAVDTQIAAGPEPVPATPPVDAAPSAGSTAGEVFAPRAAAPSAGPTFLHGIVVGAAAALAGALVGGWLSRRSLR